MLSRASGTAPILFRGQSRVYPTVYPSLLRDNVSEQDHLSWWSVTRKFISSRNGLAGYSIPSPHDALAIVQHYLLKSPVIDVTGTPKIALYFALAEQASGATRVVYAADAAVLGGTGLVVTDHAFLALPLEQGGRKHRWLRQDGYTVGVHKWENLEASRNLDFAHCDGVEPFTFQFRDDDKDLVKLLRKEFGDLEDIEGDPLAGKVRSVFEIIARATGSMKAVQRLIVGTKTLDAHGQLVAEIERLIEKAQRFGRSEIVSAQLQDLLTAAKSPCWDMGGEASLDYWIRELAVGK
jgi:hypothetical protein